MWKCIKSILKCLCVPREVVKRSGKENPEKINPEKKKFVRSLLIIEDTNNKNECRCETQFDEKFISLKQPIVRVRREARHDRLHRCRSEYSNCWCTRRNPSHSIGSTVSSLSSDLGSNRLLLQQCRRNWVWPDWVELEPKRWAFEQKSERLCQTCRL